MKKIEEKLFDMQNFIYSAQIQLWNSHVINSKFINQLDMKKNG